MIEVLHLIKMPAPVLLFDVSELGAICVTNDVAWERNDLFELVSGRDLYHILNTWYQG